MLVSALARRRSILPPGRPAAVALPPGRPAADPATWTPGGRGPSSCRRPAAVALDARRSIRRRPAAGGRSFHLDARRPWPLILPGDARRPWPWTPGGRSATPGGRRPILPPGRPAAVAPHPARRHPAAVPSRLATPGGRRSILPPGRPAAVAPHPARRRPAAVALDARRSIRRRPAAGGRSFHLDARRPWPLILPGDTRRPWPWTPGGRSGDARRPAVDPSTWTPGGRGPSSCPATPGGRGPGRLPAAGGRLYWLCRIKGNHGEHSICRM